MRITIAICMIIFAIPVMAQTEIDFTATTDAIGTKNPKSNNFETLNSEIVQLPSKKVLALSLNGTITLKNVKDLGLINFDFATNTNSGITVFKFTYKKAGTSQGMSLPFSASTKELVNSNIFIIENVKAEILNTNDITFSIVSTTAEQIYISKITAYPMTDEVRDSKKASDFYESFVLQTEVNQFNNFVAESRTKAISNFTTVNNLYYKYNTLASLSELTVFVGARSAMINPSSYSSFNKKIRQLKKYADPRNCSLVDNLTKNLEKSIQKKPMAQKIGNILNIGGNILNLVSGGSFNSVFNSIKTIAATVFNEDILKSKYQQTNFSPQYVDDNPKKGILSESYSSKLSARYDSANAVGNEVQDYFNFFLDTLESEQHHYTSVIETFDVYSDNIGRETDALLRIKENFFHLYNIRLTEEQKKALIQSSNVTSEETYGPSVALITAAYAELQVKTKDQIAANRKRLEALNSVNAQINQHDISYKEYSSNLYSMFIYFAEDLNRDNPYKFHPEVKAEFEELNRKAKEKYCPLMKRLAVILAKPADYADHKESLKAICPDIVEIANN